MESSFELFDHTADMGLRVRAPDLAGLVAPAASALYLAIGELIGVGEAEPFEFEASGDDDAILLRDYLSELLMLFEQEGRMVTSLCGVEFGGGSLRVSAETCAIDLDRCELHREVKAVTYHELAIREIEGGVEATLIVDI